MFPRFGLPETAVRLITEHLCPIWRRLAPWSSPDSLISTPLGYGLAIRVAFVWGCIYYGILFCFLQTLLRRTSWAFAGLALALALQCFGGMVGTHKWALPSGTVLRYSFDMLFFMTCLAHARSGRAWLGLPIGALAGGVLLFGVDTGLYLTVCFGFYLVAAARLKSRGAGKQCLKTALLALPAYFAVALAGLSIASRGTLFQAKFWSKWLEAVFEYGGGISDLPIADAIVGWRGYLILSLVLVSYLVAIVWMFQRLWFRTVTAEELITGLVAMYGMATLLLFVGRSDPSYLRNVSVPYCVVLMRLLLVAYAWVEDKTAALFLPERRARVRKLLKPALGWRPARCWQLSHAMTIFSIIPVSFRPLLEIAGPRKPLKTTITFFSPAATRLGFPMETRSGRLPRSVRGNS